MTDINIMNGYTINIFMRAVLAVVVVCLCLGFSGCAELWMMTYRAKGGYYQKAPTQAEWARQPHQQKKKKP